MPLEIALVFKPKLKIYSSNIVFSEETPKRRVQEEVYN
jgi:hypothetical protein